jgi:hypothetical protein
MVTMISTMFDNTTLTLSKNIKIMTKAAFDLHKKQYPNVIDLQSTDMQIEKRMHYEGQGPAPVKTEMAAAAQTRIFKGWVDIIVQKQYYFDMPVSIEQRTYAQKNVGFINQLGQYNARSINLAYEYVGISPINNAVSTSYLGGDGVAYISASHTWKSGGTYSNLLDQVVLGRDSLEAALKAVSSATMEKSIPASLVAEQVTIGTDNIFVLPELMKSVRDPETNNNTYNTFQDWGLKKNLNNYKSDLDSYTIDTNVKTRAMLESRKPKATSYMENDTDTLVERISAAVGAGFFDQLGTFHSVGA